MVYILASILFFYVCRYKILALYQTSTFKNYINLLMCVFVCACGEVLACMEHLWRSEDSLQHVDPRD